MSFRDIALPLSARGIPCTPVLPNTKKAFLPDWPMSATIDVQQIEMWDRMYPNYNVAAVATGKPDGIWFFEADSDSVWDRIQAETGHDYRDLLKTYRVRSSGHRGHLYFRNTPTSIEMGNLSQSYVKHGDFSVRVMNMYCVGAGSIHPHTGLRYECIDDTAQVMPAPDWFVQWLVNQKTNNKTVAEGGAIPVDPAGLIPHGYIHGWMVSQAGRLRQMGLGIEQVEICLLDLTHRFCAPPIDDAKVSQVARSFERYEPGSNANIILNQQPQVALYQPEEIELPTFDKANYPKFPSYVWSETSIYENFVKPICEHNSRIPYFMWLPATAMLLNYLGTKVRLKGRFDSRPFRGSIFAVLIGKRGETNKSSSMDDAMNYFNYMGVLAHAGRDTKTAEGRSLVWTAGSAEGLGLEMQKTNCKNAILYYDELSQLVKKAGIDGSTMNANLLLLYESKKYANTVKHTKEAYSLDPDSYCASLLACCTTESFDEVWSKMAGNDTGLNDRFFFILEPEALPDRSIKVDVNTMIGSQETKRRIDKAIAQQDYEIENLNNEKLQALVALGNRYVDRAVKWALAIAVDLGLDIIDDECVDRGCDIVRYEIEVKNYLKAYQAITREAELQLRIRTKLELHEGKLPLRDLKRLCHADRYGTTAWNQAYYGLVKNSILMEVLDGKIRHVQVLEKRDIEEE